MSGLAFSPVRATLARDPGIGPFVCGVCLMNKEAVILYSCLLMVRARGRERGAKGGGGEEKG